MARTLLLADDSITIQKVVSITFAAEDFTVVTVDNGEDAFARAQELRPAIVIADVAMPRRNGYELSQALKSDPNLRGIPVLLLAGTFEPLDPAKAAASQANGHLVKPFDTQSLIDKVNELLGMAPAAPGPAAFPAPVAQVPAAARPAAAAWPASAPTRPQPLSPPQAQPMAQPMAQPGGIPQRPVPLSPPQARPPTSPFGIPAAPGIARPATPMPLAPAPAAPRAPLPLTSPFPTAPSAVPMRPAAAAPTVSPFSPPPAVPRPSVPAPAPFGRPLASPPIPLGAPAAPSPSRVPVPFPAIPAAAQPAPRAAVDLWGPPQARPPQPMPLQPSAPVAFAPPLATPAQAPARVPVAVPLPAPAAKPAATRPSVPTPAWVEAAPPPQALVAPPPESPASFQPEPFGIPGFDEPAPSEISGMAEAAAAASVQSSPADLSLDVPMDEEPPELLPEIEGFELGSSQNLDVSMTGGSASAFISGELSDFSQQGGLAPMDGLDFDGSAGAEQPIELASPHEFLDSTGPDAFATTAPVPIPAPRVAAPMPVAAASAMVPAPAAMASAPSAQPDGEAALRLALSQASREVIERVVWEVVPQLAEIILREHVERMERERQ